MRCPVIPSARCFFHLSSLQTITAWGAVAFFLFQSLVCSGQNPTFIASADTREVLVGQVFDVSFALEGAEGQRFTPPSFRDFKNGAGVSESRGFAIVKGRTSVRHIWSYSLEAVRPGVYTIGPATVTANGKTMNTQPLAITVVAGDKKFKGGATIPGGRTDDVFITGELSQKAVYPGQQVTWRLVLYTKVAIEGADLISLPDFEGFYSKERRRFDTRVQYQELRGKKYAVKILHEESLFPQRTGELTIGAAQIRVGIEQAGSSGFLFGPKPVTLNTPPVVLTVKPLPDPPAPGFTGGVGQYTWEVSADSTIRSTDDALTLVVSIKGNGDSRRFGPPVFAMPEGCEIFDPRILEEEEYETLEMLMHSKKLEYVVLPKEPGVYEFAPQLVFFDPDSNQYRTLTAAPIRLEVSAGKNYQPGSRIDSLAAVPPPATRKSMWDKAAFWLVSPQFWVILGVTLTGFGLFFFLRRKQKATPPPPLEEPLISHPPSMEAKQYLTRAYYLLQHGNPTLFYDELLKSLQRYIASRLQLSTAQMNHPAIQAKLLEKGVTPIRVQAYLSIWDACELAVFAGQPDASKMESDWRTAEKVIHEIEKELK